MPPFDPKFPTRDVSTSDRQATRVTLLIRVGDQITPAAVADALQRRYSIETVECDEAGLLPGLQPQPDLLLSALAVDADPGWLARQQTLLDQLASADVPHVALIARERMPPAMANAVGMPFAGAELRDRIDAALELARLRRSASRAKRAESRDGFLVALDDAVRPLIDPNQITAISARMLGEHLGVDRCAYAEVEADQDTMNLTGNYCRHAGIKSIVGRLTFTSFGEEVLRLMRANQPFVVDDVDTHEPAVVDKGAYRATQIRAVICVPLHKSGQFVAAMAVHCDSPRRWRPDEVELLRSVANRCWESIDRARLTRDLMDIERRLGLAQRAARIGVFEWFVEDDRVIWTPELEALYGMPPGAFTGGLSAWAAHVVPEDAARVTAQFRAAFADRVSQVTYEFRARIGPDPSEQSPTRWFAGQASTLFDPVSGRPARMIGVNIDIDERKRAQDALDDARRRLETTLRAVEVGTFAYDVRTDQSSIDRNIATMFGFEDLRAGDGTSPNFHDRIHPEDRDRHVAAMWAALTNDSAETFSSEFRVVRPRDSTIRWLSVRAAITRDPTTRQATRMDGVVLDVTARRGAESLLRASEERYRSLVQATAQIVWTADADGHLTADSITWGDYTGQMPAQFARRGWLEAVHPEDRDAVAQAWEGSIASGEPMEAEFRLRRGVGDSYRRVLLRGVAVRRPDGSAKEWVGTVADVEEQRRVTDALQQSESRFRQLADSLPMLMWTARPDGTPDWFNHRFEEYTGIPLPELLKEGGRSLIHHPEYLDRARAAWSASAIGGTPFEMEFPLRAADGTFRTFLARGEPVRDAGGRIVQWIGTMTDIEQKRQLLDAERNARAEAERVGRMKDEFLATLSHELRTPLNAILGWAQLLQRGTLRENEARSAIATIERNARAQTQMIEDLLDMSRIVSGKVRLDVQRVDLAEVAIAALHSVEPTAAGRGVRLERILDPLAGPVSGDPARLQQVIWNLLANAIKFTPVGGKVQVVLERVNSHLELSVSDTGVGITPDFLPFVFDRFRQADASSTRQFGGLGLGLSIVRQLVELHGGTVRAKSPGEGKGATFIVALPLAVTHEHAEGRDHPRRSSPARHDEPTPWLDGLTALVVDDEPDARALVKRLLEDRHARVFTAPNAAEAVAIVEAHRPDVILSDIGMPSVDGYELIRRIRALGRERGGNAPAIALTAFARTDDRRRALLAGFQSHVAKPTEAAELIAVVASVTGRTGLSV